MIVTPEEQALGVIDGSMGTQLSYPNLSCDVVFDPEEWQTNIKTPKLGEMVRLIANFGGFLDRKSDGFSDAQALWQGMGKVKHYALGIKIGRTVHDPSD